jgi:hypothetical protein
MLRQQCHRGPQPTQIVHQLGRVAEQRLGRRLGVRQGGGNRPGGIGGRGWLLCGSDRGLGGVHGGLDGRQRALGGGLRLSRKGLKVVGRGSWHLGRGSWHRRQGGLGRLNRLGHLPGRWSGGRWIRERGRRSDNLGIRLRRRRRDGLGGRKRLRRRSRQGLGSGRCAPGRQRGGPGTRRWNRLGARNWRGPCLRLRCGSRSMLGSRRSSGSGLRPAADFPRERARCEQS